MLDLQQNMEITFCLVLGNKPKIWVENKSILPDHSLDFRKRHRTEDGLFISATLLDKYVKKAPHACFVDFVKFYATISHDFFFLN